MKQIAKESLTKRLRVKALSVLLSLVLALCALPVPAFAKTGDGGMGEEPMSAEIAETVQLADAVERQIANTPFRQIV